MTDVFMQSCDGGVNVREGMSESRNEKKQKHMKFGNIAT